MSRYVTTRSQTQQVSDVGAALANCPSRQRRKPLLEKDSLDDELVGASLSSPRTEKDAAGVLEEALNGTGEQRRELGSQLDSAEGPLEGRQFANEANSLNRVKEANMNVRIFFPANLTGSI